MRPSSWKSRLWLNQSTHSRVNWFEVVESTPWSPVADQFGLVEADDRLGHGVDAPICQETRSGCLRVLASSMVDHDSLVDLSGDESLQAADDVTLGEPFCGASSDVVDGGPVVLHTDDDSAVDGGVGLTVSAPVEAVTVGHPRRSGN